MGLLCVAHEDGTLNLRLLPVAERKSDIVVTLGKDSLHVLTTDTYASILVSCHLTASASKCCPLHNMSS